MYAIFTVVTTRVTAALEKQVQSVVEQMNHVNQRGMRLAGHVLQVPIWLLYANPNRINNIAPFIGCDITITNSFYTINIKNSTND
jgi:hypothetical protein